MPAEVTDVSSSDRDQISERCGWRAVRALFRQGKQRFLLSDRAAHHYAPGRTLVGYYQYVNAYQERSARGENDETMATAVFTDITRKFSQAQMLQQALLLNVSNEIDESASIDERVIAAKYAKNLSRIHMRNLGSRCLKAATDGAQCRNLYRLGNGLQARSRRVALSQQRSTVPIASCGLRFRLQRQLAEIRADEVEEQKKNGNGSVDDD